MVEYGAGHGHLTRAVAEAIGRPAVGLERRLALVDTARALTADERVRFEARDARADPVSLGPDDLLLGLHACGALGDSLVQAAAQRGCAVMLVSCCPQKVPGPSREPISALGRSVGLSLERPLLGLANLATPLEGGADAADVMARRHRRRALYLLLREAGVELSPGDETRGLSRRRFRHPLEALIPFAFARRGLAAPSARAVGRAAERARMEHDLIRRYALPRTMLARALEVAIAADRAQALAEAGPGSPVRLVEAFARSSSPRNLLIQRGPVG